MNVGGQEVFLEGLMPYECPECEEQTWPNSELTRAREQAAVKLRRKVAA